MLKCGAHLLTCNLFLFMLTFSIPCSAQDAFEDERKLHIVYMGSLPKGEYSPSSHHFNILHEVVDSSFVSNSFIRSYKRSFNGFAAYLNTNEIQKLATMKGVVSVFPSSTFNPQTTRSWDFMGFTETISRNNTAESNLIIGVIDTGIWPESESFSDKGFGPAPKKWKGACEGGKNFSCNNKIIGARYYALTAPGSESARDDMGHGSHTASIAAGNIVNNAGFYGLAEGTARGGVPSARIAVYKVCDPIAGCTTANILAAFDDAIADGVDILTISLGPDFQDDLDRDVISIGSFHALDKGVLTIQAAGNGGCGALGAVSSTAPWLLTVGASSIDRKFVNNVFLGNGSVIMGLTINSFTLNGTMLPLVYGKDVSRQCPEADAKDCAKGCVDRSLVKGKIVLCSSIDGVDEVYRAGALGAIFIRTLDDVSSIVPLPASAISVLQLFLVEDYVNLTKSPMAKILRSELLRDFKAPVLASFSSCGPNNVVPEIMKPDVIAPGVGILGAYSPIASPSGRPLDSRKVHYTIASGTSMACPHAAGLAAYVKSVHPDWSPSAIKSAIMTTARPITVSTPIGSSYAVGSGHIDPLKAANPGLVYDADKEDYIKLLCGLGLTSDSLGHITGDNSTCLAGFNRVLPLDFNYPAISFNPSPNSAFIYKFRRTVTNVGLANSTYKVEITPDDRITIQVLPTVLSFKSLHEKKSFVVTVEGPGLPDLSYVYAPFVWSDGIHSVRSPIAIFTFDPDFRV